METEFKAISPEAQATLLLAAPLLAGKQKGETPLSQGELNKLSSELQKRGVALEELLGSKGKEIVGDLPLEFDREQIQSLLGRGFLLSLAVEKWRSLGIWIVCRNDPGYPTILRRRLNHLAPPLLYGCGEADLLNAGGVAIVGSRDFDDEARTFTEALAANCAKEKLTVISGGAKGVDQIAMRSAAANGGCVVGVLAADLARSVASANARDLIRENRVVLVSPYDPEAGFNVGHAMGRNKVIYAFADYGIVVSSSFNEGGTWAGAIEQLEKFKEIPIFVRDGSNVPKGNQELIRRGARVCPNLQSGDLKEALSDSRFKVSRPLATGDLFESMALREQPK